MPKAFLESEKPKQPADVDVEEMSTAKGKESISENVGKEPRIEDKIRNNTYNALSINNEKEKEFEKEWYQKYAKHPRKIEDFFNDKNIEEVKEMPEEKRIFFLKMAKFYLDADISKIESDFGKDDAGKIFEYLVEERKNQLAMNKKMKSNSAKAGNGKADSLRVVGKNMEKFYITREEKKEFTDADMEERSTKDQEFAKAGEDEQRIFSEISKIKEKDKQLVAFGKNINDVIGAFENSEKNKKDFNLMMEKFNAFGWHNNVKDAWNQEQVDKILEIYEDNIDNLDPLVCSNFFTEVLGHGHVNDLVARYFIRRVESGKEMPKSLLKEIGYWAGDNLYAMDSDVVSDFLLTLINNSDKVDRSFMGKIFSDFEWDYLEMFVRRFSEELYKNNDDVYKTLKNIEVLEYFKHMIDEQYFEKDTVKYNLNVFKKKNHNYFVNFKIDQVLEFYNKTHSIQEKRNCLEAIKNEYDDLEKEMPNVASMPDQDVAIMFDDFKESIDAYFTEKENIRRKNVYDDEKIRKAYDIEPAIFMYKDYNDKEIEIKKNEYCFTKISDKYGIIYNSSGGIDSFFELGGTEESVNNIEKTVSENLSINEVLDREGFKKENMVEEEYKKMILTYKTLIELPMREKIEKEFDIDLKDFNIREQVQFVTFLSSKSKKEAREVKEFLNQSESEEAKNNRIKSFLSLESGGREMGGKILDIGEILKSQPEIADLLFSEYAKVVDRINENAEELCKIYDEIYSEKKLDKNEASQAILARANNLLLEGSIKLEKAGQSEQKEIINKIIGEFEQEAIANRREIDEFRSMAEKLNSKYREIDLGEESPQQGDRNFEQWLKSDESKDLSEEEKRKILSIYDEGKKFDSNKIRAMIAEAEMNLKEHEHPDYADYDLKSSPEKYAEGMKIFNKESAVIYKEKIGKLHNILPYQIAFEKKLESLILGKETASLGNKMFNDIEERAKELQPEKFPSDKQAYFPVGISSNLPEWESIFEGREKMAKPMDIYGYMFWLNNQRRNIKLIVCDQMQASNYEALYGKRHDEALEATKKIGEKERRFYGKIIDTFGLKNIEIMDYESFIERDKDKFEKYRTLCERLSKNPAWEKAFSEMIQESVSQKTSDDEKDNLLKYGIEELCWILSYDGVKVSHIKEARYDSIASVISNTENICERNGIDIFDPANEKKIMPAAAGVIKELKNIYNTNKLNLEKDKGKDSCDALYYKKMHETISKIKCEKEIRSMLEVERKDIEVNFVCPTMGSFSFGWRGTKKDEKESALKFKEAYSTYFCKGGANMFLDSDQVVASPKGHIGGKILTLENEKQRIYAEKVIKPILIEYFKVLESAPDEYFEKIKKTKEDLLSECKDSKTLSDILKFIQFNIMEPTFSR